MKVGRHDELKLVSTAEVDNTAALHHLLLEGELDKILEELQAHLAADDGDLGVELENGTDQTAVVGLGVRAHQVIDVFDVHDAGEGVDVQLAEFLVRGVYEGGLISALDDVGVIRGTLLEAEFDVEAVAVPVEGANARGVGADLRHLRLKALGSLEHLDVRVLHLRGGGFGNRLRAGGALDGAARHGALTRGLAKGGCFRNRRACGKA